METLRAPLRELGEFEEIQKNMRKKGGSCIALTGCVDSQKMHMVYGLSEKFSKKLIVTYSEARAREIMEDYSLYDKNILYYPTKDLIFYQADITGLQLAMERIKVFRRLLEEKECTVVTVIDSMMVPQMPFDILKESILSIEKGKDVDEREFAGRLTALGYERVPQVEKPGEFSVRGGILDIFDVTEDNPCRIELWGDTVTEIRSFDVLSQRSVEKLEKVIIYPGMELLLSEDLKAAGLKKIREEAKKQEAKLQKEAKTEEAFHVRENLQKLETELETMPQATGPESFIHFFYEDTETFLDLFDRNDSCVFLDEPVRIREHADMVAMEYKESMTHRMENGYMLPGQLRFLDNIYNISTDLQHYSLVSISALQQKNPFVKSEWKYHIEAKSMSSYNNSFEDLVKDLKRYKKAGARVLLLSGSRTRAKRLAGDLLDNDLTAFYSEDRNRVLKPGEIMTYYGRVLKGFEYPLLKFVVISESDIFSAGQKKKKPRKKFEGMKSKDFENLKVGDYVVHENHGLGIYQGIEKVEIDHVVKDYMKIEYRDGGNLYVLATNLGVIQKYASAEAKKPKLNKLGTQEWTKTKTKVREAVGEAAEDLVRLYATRGQQEGFVYGPDTTWQTEFEEMFPFEETDDQLLAIDAVKADMESRRIMDRLICGDVGYGKTEVAIRAAFKAVQEQKQVVYLVPTTILAQQHYNTFVQRMKDYPVTIELLSRFRSTTEQKKTVERLKKGLVDIVIGTHRVLSKDVSFHDLGLLIIDEEQRFGVSHKEKIKKLKESVDVLTLTATPIPRTLHMSLIGIRDMSVLEEAPEDRMPVQTFVCEYNEEMVREAILRETSRNGQVFYLYNRVNNIAEMAAGIARLAPEATVAYAHGQMKEAELEKIMYDFIQGEIDVLVSTTIIETGLDIPNANTIIIHDAENMGLSQLYQLRGRVGRSNRNAYAFLMYKRDRILREVAEKRLQAIREFTDLGSGYKIAMRDLEIRGAGNLLGTNQHGHMAAVGYDLYCKMLNEAVRTMKGESTTEDFNTTVELDVDAYIPPTYIVNEFQKLEIYKRIAGLESQAECDDMKEELLDRFGEIPLCVEHLMRAAMIRVRAHRLYVTEVKGKNRRLQFTMKEDGRIDVEGIPTLLKKYKGSMTFSAKPVPVFALKYVTTGIIDRDEEDLLVLTESVLESMEEHLPFDKQEEKKEC